MPEPGDILEAADREVDAYQDLHELVILVPDARWDELVRLTEGHAALEGEDLRYRGALFRRGRVDVLTPQQGF